MGAQFVKQDSTNGRIDHVFFESNLDRGVLANKEDLVEAFGTDDEDLVCVEILNKGDFQVSEGERQMQADALYKDIAARVAEKRRRKERDKRAAKNRQERYY